MSKNKKKTNSVTQSAKEESLKDREGVTTFQGSSYKGKGKVDNDKIISNRKRR